MVSILVIGKLVGLRCNKNFKLHSSQLLSHLYLVPKNTVARSWQFQNMLRLESKKPGMIKTSYQKVPSNYRAWIIEVNLVRPEAKNAIGSDILRGLQHSFEAINNDSSAKVLMISSSVPRVFCAGADLKERKKMSPSEVQAFVNSLLETFSFLEALQIPTFAVIEGAALGGGLEMALSCDLRICGEAATLGLPETGLAIIPGAGGMQRLPRLVGKSVAKELIFTSQRISGQDARLIGLVNHCVPAGEAYLRALEVAREINQKGPVAIRMAKRAIDEGLHIDWAAALALEEDCYEQTVYTKDSLEGLAAFAEKRNPIYTGE